MDKLSKFVMDILNWKEKLDKLPYEIKIKNTLCQLHIDHDDHEIYLEYVSGDVCMKSFSGYDISEAVDKAYKWIIKRNRK